VASFVGDSGASKLTRILIYGVTGSGKTTLAAKLSAKTGLPWHSVDDLTYEANWTPVADDEQRRRIASICEGDAWIIDTAYGKWIDVPLARAEIIIALDYARAVSFSRLLIRTLGRLIDQRPICNENRESFRTLFSMDCILLWHFRSFERKRTRIAQLEADDSVPRVLRFTRPRDLERWLGELPPE
jgi:adenylate kinase family enzyme